MLDKGPKSSIVAALLLAVSLVTASWGRANERAVEFNIPPQALGSALLIFAKQADVQVSVSTTAIVGMQTPGVVGKLTPSIALTQLLVETELQFSTIGDRTYAIAPARGSSESEAQLPGSAAPRALIARADVFQESARADDTTTNAAQASSSREERKAVDLGDIIVTGTAIRGVSPDSSPLIVYDRERIERSGASTVSEFVRKEIPQNFALLDGETMFNSGNDTSVGGNNTRGSAVNLRGLGVESTLVLLNGRRVAPAGASGSFVDISVIPLSAVERVEVLTDGGAALYGADAIAGVVNFVLKRDFDGAETALLYGDTTEGGARDLTASQTFGRSWESGNGVLVYEYSDQEELMTAQRDFIPDQGGRFDIIPAQQRHSAVASVRQGLSDNTDVFADALFSDREFGQDSIVFGSILVKEWGDATGSSFALGLGHNFAADWRAEFSGGYSRMKEDRRGSVTVGTDVFPFEVNTESEVASLDLKTDGPFADAPGGELRASFGLTARREQFRNVTEFEREVFAAFGELFLPFVGEANARSWANRLEVSLAARYDHYDDTASSTDPRIGLLWSPVVGLNLRGTYSTAFRVPSLPQLDPAQIYQIVAIPDASAADGTTITLYPSSPGNPELRPEESESFTVGLDLRPRWLAGLAVSATYFDIDFTDRIRQPDEGIDVFDYYNQEAILAPFIDRSPDPAEIQRIFDEEIIEDFVGGATPADIEAFFDGRLHNLAATRMSGLDLSADYAIDSSAGKFLFFLAGTYLFDLELKAASTTPNVSQLNMTYRPIDLRMQGGINWAGARFSSTLSINYADNYRNTVVTPAADVDSWATADWQLGFHGSESSGPLLLQGITLTLNVQNITDVDPPRVESGPASFDLRFDSTNASARGRFISLHMRKQW